MEKHLLKQQELELRKKYEYFYLNDSYDLLTGTIFFEDVDNKYDFDLQVRITNDYPNSVPVVLEIGNKIPSDFHKNGDEQLCLETRFGEWEIFMKDKSLLNLFDNLVVPYFRNFINVQNGKGFVTGEHKHGPLGLLEDYKMRFKVKDDKVAVALLCILRLQEYKLNEKCICRSGRTFRNCHYGTIKKMSDSGFSFKHDVQDIFNWWEGKR